jgi:predicted nucleic acid-binding protein
MQGILIDTSAWIDFFREGNGRVADTVAHLIETDQAILTGVVIAELLQGIRGDKETQQLQELLGVLSYLEVQRKDWESAGQTLQDLRSRGITIPLSDAVIGAVALRHQLPVLTMDKHFEHLPVRRFFIS